MLRKVNDLDCYCDRKSFYGKCAVLMDVSGEDSNIYLLSYSTIVCYVDVNGNFFRLWEGESQTTMRHVNAFLLYLGINGGGVKWWREQPTAPEDTRRKVKYHDIA